MVGEICFERARIEADRIDRRLARQRRIRVIPNPARQGDFRGAYFAPELACAIIEKHQCITRSQNIGQVASSRPIATLRSFDLELGLAALLRYHRLHRFCIITIQPRQRGIALDCGEAHILFGERLFRFALEALGARLALFGAGEFLHHADAAHGHEVACQAEPIGRIDRKIIDAERSDRIGQLPGGHGHFARSGDGGVLRRQRA